MSTPSHGVATPPRLASIVPRDASPMEKRESNGRNDFFTNGIDQPSRHSSPDHRVITSSSSSSSSSSLSSPTRHDRFSAERQIRLCLERVLTNIQLPTQEEDIVGILSDGAILCNFVNHLKPRSVPTIHVASPQVGERVLN